MGGGGGGAFVGVPLMGVELICCSHVFVRCFLPCLTLKNFDVSQGVQFGPSRTTSHSKIKFGLNVAAPVCEQNVISVPMMHFKYLDLKMDIGI